MKKLLAMQMPHDGPMKGVTGLQEEWVGGGVGMVNAACSSKNLALKGCEGTGAG